MALNGCMGRVLVLGGTGWVGHRIAARAVERGDTVTCLARGESGAAPPGAQLVPADRRLPDAYQGLDGDWDEVIEIAHDQELVESALVALADRARHWTLVSSVSVYARTDEPGADESADLVEVGPEDGERDYAQAKVAAERASAHHLGDRLLVVRPGLIAGPGDPSDRFGYWMARLDRGGPALTPTTHGRRVQVIDVDDLADFVVGAADRAGVGVVNAVGHSHDLADVLAQTARATGFTDPFVAREDDWLLARDVDYWAGPRSLPLWLPPTHTGFADHRNDAYLAAGGTIRPLGQTISRVLADERSRGIARTRRSGLDPAQEWALLHDEGTEARPR